MTLVVGGTFVVALFVVLVSYWLFVVRPEAQEKSRSSPASKGVRKQIASISVARAPERLSHIPALESVLVAPDRASWIRSNSC